MKVTVMYSDASQTHCVALDLPGAPTVRDALERAALASLVADPMAVGVWGRVRAQDELLREGDRVEIYRPLVADPKTARRQRAERPR